MRWPSQAGTRPPCSGRSAKPARCAMPTGYSDSGSMAMPGGPCSRTCCPELHLRRHCLDQVERPGRELPAQIQVRQRLGKKPFRSVVEQLPADRVTAAVVGLLQELSVRPAMGRGDGGLQAGSESARDAIMKAGPGATLGC